MATLAEIIVKEMEFYEGFGLVGGRTLLVTNTENGVFVVVGVGPNTKPHVVVMARIEDDVIYIDADMTDKPLIDALEQAGIPREKIKLVYAGEATYELPPRRSKQATQK